MNGTVASIRSFGAACLRRPAAAVDPEAASTTALLEDLWTTLSDDGGVGLAAPQIGVGKRVVVVRDPRKPAGEQRLDLVNPVVVSTFGPETPFTEGCLSFPGLYTTVMRPRGAVVEYDSVDGRARLKDDDLVARIVQHEVDHLDGVLFIDHLSAARRFQLLPRLLAIVVGGWVRRTFPSLFRRTS